MNGAQIVNEFANNIVIEHFVEKNKKQLNDNNKLIIEIEKQFIYREINEYN